MTARSGAGRNGAEPGTALGPVGPDPRERSRSTPLRRIGGALALALLAASCVVSGAEEPSSAGRTPPGDATAPPSAEPTCPIPADVLQRIRDGFDPRRSGDVQLVPAEPNYLYGERLAGALSHSGPWDYLQRVPLLLYGPGHVAPAGRVAGAATLADVAPTLAAHLGSSFEGPDGRALADALPIPDASPPKLVLVVVWDGVGRNVLDEWPEAWPTLRSLIERGAWFEDVTVGSSPSITPAIHSTLATGALPRTHGIVDIQFRLGERMVPSNARGPEPLRVPTLADAWDLATGNRAEVAVVASHDWHLSMVGHGTALPGGDRDLAVLQDDATARWQLAGENASVFRFPGYVNDVPGLREAVQQLDRADGELDGRWLGERVLQRPEDLVYTPAVTAWQTRVLDALIAREGFGSDAVSDLLFTNYKATDRVGHRWSMNSPQMRDVVRAQDEALARLIGTLDDRVGTGEWLLVLTADHGSTPRPAVTGAFPVDGGELKRDLEEEFRAPGDDRQLVLGLRPTQLWLDRDVLAAAGHAVADVAAFIDAYTKGQAAADPSSLAEGEADDRVFAGAFPGRRLLAGGCPVANG